MALVAQLGHDLVLAGRFHHRADLVDGVGHRFFAVDVLAAFHGCDGCHGVHVVGSGDQHRIDTLVHLVVHLAEVAEDLGLREPGQILPGALGVHVAQGHELDLARLLQLIDVPAGLAPCADRGDADLLVRRSLTAAGQAMPGHDRVGRKGGRRPADKLSS